MARADFEWSTQLIGKRIGYADARHFHVDVAAMPGIDTLKPQSSPPSEPTRPIHPADDCDMVAMGLSINGISERWHAIGEIRTATGDSDECRSP